MQYCIIKGHSDKDPGPFILAVSIDQDMINGFRQEHYHICSGGEIVDDNNYDQLKWDYEIQLYGGHYMTPKMITECVQHTNNLFNVLWGGSDVICEYLDYILPDDEDTQDLIEDGIGLLNEVLADNAPIEGMLCEDESIYATRFNMDTCMESFFNTYEPTGEL